ncbi:MAG: hypothetical protein MPL62_06945, partial [Alphaproteobacteria bacterium]|nr:hypothetical protein [Alphaproteobacteria bacterium]
MAALAEGRKIASHYGRAFLVRERKLRGVGPLKIHAVKRDLEPAAARNLQAKGELAPVADKGPLAG